MSKIIGVCLGLSIVYIVYVFQDIVTTQIELSKLPQGPAKILVHKKTNIESIEEKIKQYFPKSHKTMIAIAHAESGMDMNAKGYNCYYNKSETTVYSTRVKGSHSAACKSQHRKFAYSVDCFILQKNYKGQDCPKNMTVDQHLSEVAKLSKVQGLQAWSAYKNNSYKNYVLH